MKVGRTEIQDAVLTTLGREMGAYAEAFNRDRWRVYKCEERLRVVNLGGTAIGTGAGRAPAFTSSLMIAVIFMILLFQKSENLAAAYGMAVTGSMTITGLMMILIFSQIKDEVETAGRRLHHRHRLCVFPVHAEQTAPWRLLVAHPGRRPSDDNSHLDERAKRLFKALRPTSLGNFFISYQQILRQREKYSWRGPVFLPGEPR